MTRIEGSLCPRCVEFWEPFLSFLSGSAPFFHVPNNFPDTHWRQHKIHFKETFIFQHHSSIQCLIKSGTQGCKFCGWLMRRIPERHPDYEGSILGSIFLILKAPEFGDFDLCQYENPTSFQRYCKIKLVTLHQHSSFLEARPSQLEGPLRSLPQMLPARDSVAEIAANAKKMLSLCTSSHKKCAATVPNTMPTRIIDVGTLECSILRLITTANAPPQRYAILTYRWGVDGGSYKLLKDRLEDYHRGIPETRLPATLVDAIGFTRQLGIRYLWIDALCILQDADNRIDWNTEASKMREYYGSAHVCLSALCATSAESGLFRSCCDRHEEYELALIEGSRVGLTPCHTSMQDTESFDEDRSFDSAFKSSPLNFRGWTLQERLLSQRLLHIGRHQVYLECSSCQISERSVVESEKSQGRAQFDSPGTFLSLPRFAEFRRQMEEAPGEISQEMILKGWYELVMEYGPREVQEVEDKLMAFDGLRMLFQLGMQCGYFYGLWEADVCNGLLWFNGTHVFHIVKQSVYDPQSISLYKDGSSTSTSSGGSYIGDGTVEHSYILGSGHEHLRQFWHGHSFQGQQPKDELQEHQKAKCIEAASQTKIQSYPKNNVYDHATSIPLIKSLPTWSWASCTTPLSSCVVNNSASIEFGRDTIPRTKVDVMKLGHMEVAGSMKPFIAIRATVAKLEVVQGRMISSLQYLEVEHGRRRLITVTTGASNVYLDRELREPAFTTHGLIMYESGYREDTLNQSVLTLLLVKKAHFGRQTCIEGGIDCNQVYERIGLGFFRHERLLQFHHDQSELDCSETVYLI